MNWTPEVIKSLVTTDSSSHNNVAAQRMSPLIKSQQSFEQAVHGLIKDGSFKVFPRDPVGRISDDINDGLFVSHNIHPTASSSKGRVRTFSGDSQNSVEEELIILKHKVESQKETVESLKLTMLNVQDDSKKQQTDVELIQKRFHGHRVIIDRTLQQTQLALQDQQQMLYKQETIVKALENERLHIGSVWTESVYILMGMYVIQTPLVKYTVQLISLRLDKRGQSKKWLPRFLQILFFMHFLKLCKSVDSYLGLTSGLWSALRWTGNSLIETIRKLTSVKGYKSITYSSAAMKDWSKPKKYKTVGLNNLNSQNIIIETGADTVGSPNSMDIC